MGSGQSARVRAGDQALQHDKQQDGRWHSLVGSCPLAMPRDVDLGIS